MKDSLTDLIQHTHQLGVIDLIKVTGTDTETTINAISESRTVIVSGAFKDPIPEFIGVFGMPNLPKLKTILGFTEYGNDAKITVNKTNRDGVDIPTTIHFETKHGDFVNDYRLMAKTLIEDRVKAVTYKGTSWQVEFEPSVASIMRLKKQAAANSEETVFTTKVENGDLKVFFGDPSTHNGNFVFQSRVSGSLSRAHQWPVKEFLSILDLAGDKTIKITDQGAAQITVDSGIAVYKYLIPSQSK